MKLSRLTKSQLEEAVLLADRVFRDREQISMGKAFPQIFHPPLESHSFGVYENGKLVSFMGLVPGVVKVGEAKLKIFSLGSVCTDPLYRGRGYASRLLEEVVVYAKEAQASLLLVSGTLPLYRRIGCHPFGNVRRYRLPPDLLRSLPSTIHSGYLIRERKSTDILEMALLADRREVAYAQSLFDLSTLLEQEAFASCVKMRHQIWVAEKNGRLEGYLVVGVPKKSGDPPRKREVDSKEESFLSDTPINPEKLLAIEWAGNPHAVVALMAHAVRAEKETILDIPIPKHEKELHRLMSSIPYAEEPNQGTVKILNLEVLNEQLKPYFNLIPSGQREKLEELFDASKEWEEEKRVRNLFELIPFPYTAGLNYI
ncbi:GNAT family N-acetyltransferase [Thermicanus aegyptius]|uniref:GNAT family N-acetyltransferase n=1 Tax=Thermicanus aegyptius TaxID=94009 RepID=UPI0004098356|nr:GNAT family N-acetyltransferase [Thermicanus aegyptius]